MSVAHINITDTPEGVQTQVCFEGEPGSNLKESDFNPASPAHQVANALLTVGAEAIGLVQQGDVEVSRVMHKAASDEATEGGIIIPASLRKPADVLSFPQHKNLADNDPAAPGNIIH